MTNNPVNQLPRAQRQLPRAQRPGYRRWGFAAAGLVALASLAVLYTYDPAVASFFPPCPFYALTGLYCPGCGTLRALHQVLHGHPLAAMGHNPLTIMSLPFVGYAALSWAALAATRRRLPRVFIPPVWIWTLMGAVVAFWVLRNLPFFPFSMLAP